LIFDLLLLVLEFFDARLPVLEALPILLLGNIVLGVAIAIGRGSVRVPRVAMLALSTS